MNILFTLLYVDGHHGSILHVKELGEYFAGRVDEKSGERHVVTAVTVFATEEMREEFARAGIRVLDVDAFEPEGVCDCVFAHHFPVLDALLCKGLECRKIVLSSLSGMLEIESFPIWHDQATVLTVMSVNTARKHHANYGIPLERMEVFENSIPDKFANFERTRRLPPARPNRVAAVSNHRPPEVAALKSVLPPDIEIDFVGMNGNIYREVTPDFLARYDLVITIGKTVQYALALGIPVYEYDHFGGNGYITPDNMAEEAVSNFSGRSGMRCCTTETLADELLSGYPMAVARAEELRALAIDRFLLSKKMDALLALVEQRPDVDMTGLRARFRLEHAHGKSFCDYVAGLRRDCEHLLRKCVHDREEGYRQGLEQARQECFPDSVADCTSSRRLLKSAIRVFLANRLPALLPVARKIYSVCKMLARSKR